MADDVVLIGGQAWSFWAELFEQCSAELAQGAPYTSKDIDFFGSAEHVERCANLLGAQHKLYGPPMKASNWTSYTPLGACRRTR
jgi:hypothetical protein